MLLGEMLMGKMGVSDRQQGFCFSLSPFPS
jgi:hypothetical protein